MKYYSNYLITMKGNQYIWIINLVNENNIMSIHIIISRKIITNRWSERWLHIERYWSIEIFNGIVIVNNKNNLIEYIFIWHSIDG